MTITLACKYTDYSFKSYKDHYDFFKDLIIGLPISIIFGAMFEKMLKEQWVLLDSFKKSEYIFRNLLNAMDDIIFITDFDKKILFCN